MMNIFVGRYAHTLWKAIAILALMNTGASASERCTTKFNLPSLPVCHPCNHPTIRTLYLYIHTYLATTYIFTFQAELKLEGLILGSLALAISEFIRALRLMFFSSRQFIW